MPCAVHQSRILHSFILDCQIHLYADDTLLYGVADDVQVATEKLQLVFN